MANNKRQDEWIITLGFPCQDISIAGRGEGITGSRSNLWFEAFEIIGILQPRFALIENVGAITFRGLWRILSDLASIGYDASWQDIRASDVGAPHRRERIWIVAYPQSERTLRESENIRRSHGGQRGTLPWESIGTSDVAYPIGRGCGTAGQQGRLGEISKEGTDFGGKITKSSQNVADTPDSRDRKRMRDNEERQTINERPERFTQSQLGEGSQDVADSTILGCEEGSIKRGEISEEIGRTESDIRNQASRSHPGDWLPEPTIRGVANGISPELYKHLRKKHLLYEGRLTTKQPQRANRLKALGNSIVPQIAELLFRRLKEIE